MANASFKEISVEGLWKNNPVLVQLLGLCPLLAVSASVVNALGLSLATLLVLVGSNTTVSLIRHHVTAAVRLPAFVMIIASFTTCAELLMQAFAYELYQVLGIFIPLIVTNCAILGRAEAFACKKPVLDSALDGFMMAAGFALVLVSLGAVREFLGTGVIFANMDLLLPITTDWRITIIPGYKNFLLAILPPGAFICVGFMIALKNIVDAELEKRRQAKAEVVLVGSKRVRVTGKIS